MESPERQHDGGACVGGALARHGVEGACKKEKNTQVGLRTPSTVARTQLEKANRATRALALRYGDCSAIDEGVGRGTSGERWVISPFIDE